MKLIPIIGSLCQVNEFLCYALIYFDVMKHNMSMARNSIISMEVYRSRKHRHFFTLSCQVTCFVVDALFILHIVFLHVAYNEFSSKEISFSLRVPQFAIQTMLQILTTQEIRVNFFVLAKKLCFIK